MTQSYQELREQTLALFPEITEIARRNGAAETERRLVAAKVALEESVLLAVVCGEFKRGKSSLLNALLEEPGLFPVDDYYATSLVTSVSYGDQERVVVRLADQGGATEDRLIKRGELEDYVTEGGNPGNEKRVRLVAIETPNKRLASGLTLLDTPGVGGVYDEHAAATTAALSGAHAIVFVADATQPLTSSELDFLRRSAEMTKVIEDEDALFFVLTKTDLVSDFDAILTNTRSKLAQVTARPEASVTVVPVSSQAKLSYLADKDETDLTLSNFAALEQVLWAALNRRQAKVNIAAALSELERGAVALLQPIEVRLNLITERGTEREAELRDALTARQRRLDELKRGDAAWRRELEQGVRKMTRDVQSTSLAGVDRVWTRLKAEYLNDDDLLYDTDSLVNHLIDDMAAVVATANRLLDDRAAKLQRDFARRHDLDIGQADIARLPDPPVTDLRVTATLGRSERPNSLLRNWRDVSTGGTAGGTVGAVVGGLIGTFALPVVGTWIGAAIGSALGGVVGGAFGLRTSAKAVKQQDHEARRRSLLTTLEPFYKEQRQHISDALSDVSVDFTDVIRDELDSRIVQERDSVEESVRRARETSQRSAEEAKADLAELSAERKPLDRLRVRVAGLARAVADLTAPGGSTQAGAGSDGSWADE